MKKIFATAAIALFMMTSCSDDDSSSNNNNNNNPDAVLLKKTIETYGDGSTLTSEYHYNGNKLSSIHHSDDQDVNFTYTGDKVTKVEYFEADEMVQRTVFTYDGQGRVATMIEYGFDEEDLWAEKTTYTYNSNGTISIVLTDGDHTSQTEVWDEGTITVENGNVTNIELQSSNSSYVFDSKNNPEKNITGIDQLNIAWYYGGLNNITSATYSDDTEGYSATYTYNSENYPISAIEEDLGETTNIQYFYE